jgi:predicted lipoprotein with Yx(FWY)xxD motif
MRSSGFEEQGRDGDRRRRRLPVILVGFVLLAMLAVGVIPTAATATVLYPPVAGSAIRTAEGFELTGTIYPEGNDATWHFEYGTTTAYGQSAPMPDADAGSTGFSIAVSQPITGLAPDTTYHYRLVSTNAVEGTADSADRTFSTAEGTTTTPPPAGGSSPAPGGGAGSGTGTTETPTAGGAGVTVGGSGPKTVVKLATVKGRSLLATTAGRTLYSLSVERHGRFVCTMASGCLEVWHPLTVASGVVPKGPVTLGTVKRPEGQLQVTYRGLPLYTFSGDKKPGQVKGEGLKDVGIWHAAVAPGHR